MQVPKTGSQWLLGSGKTTIHSKPRCSGDEEERKEGKKLNSVNEKKNRLNKLGTDCTGCVFIQTGSRKETANPAGYQVIS